MLRTALIYSDDMKGYDMGLNHPMRPERLRLVYELVSAYGLIGGDSRLLSPIPARRSDLESVHLPEYIDAVKALSGGSDTPSPTAYGFGSADNPPFLGMYEASMLYTGASLQATELVASGRYERVFSISGGLHHAMPRRASGFCVFNDVAVAIQSLRRRFTRIAYIDVDAHHGNGVQAAFYDAADVLTISIHETGDYLFPGSGFTHEIGIGAGRGYSVNIPLTPSTPDSVYLRTFDEIVPRLIESYDPQIVVAQLGVDAHFSDPLTHLILTSRGFTAVVERILGFGRPLVAFGGGGYNLTAVPRLWTLAYAMMADRELDDRVPDAYARSYGITHLHDRSDPEMTRHQRHNVVPDAEQAIRQIREWIFPLHGISSE